MPETTIIQIHTSTGAGIQKWQAVTPGEDIVDLRNRKRVTDLRCSLWRHGKPDRIGTAWIVRNANGSVSVKATPRRPRMKYAYRLVDMDTDEAVLVGNIKLFDEPYHDPIDIAEAKRVRGRMC